MQTNVIPTGIQTDAKPYPEFETSYPEFETPYPEFETPVSTTAVSLLCDTIGHCV